MMPLSDASGVASPQLPSSAALPPPVLTERTGERRSVNGMHRATVPGPDASAASAKAADEIPAWLEEAQSRLSLGAISVPETDCGYTCAPSAAAQGAGGLAAGSAGRDGQAGTAARDARGGPGQPALPEQLRSVLSEWARSKLDQCIPSSISDAVLSISDAVLGPSGSVPDGGGGGPGGRGGGQNAGQPGGNSSLGMAASGKGGGGGPRTSRVQAIRLLVGAGEFEDAALLASDDDELMGWVQSARQASERLVHEAMSRQFEALLERGKYQEAAYFVRTPAEAVRISRMIARESRRPDPASPVFGGAGHLRGSEPGRSVRQQGGAAGLPSVLMGDPSSSTEPPLGWQLQGTQQQIMQHRLEQQQHAHGDGEPAGGRPRQESIRGQQQQGRQAGPRPHTGLRSVASAEQHREWPAEEHPEPAQPTHEEAWVLYEQRRAQWLQYYIECGDLDRALNLCLTPRERARVLSASRIRAPWRSSQELADGSNEAYGTDARHGTDLMDSGKAAGAQPLVRFAGTPPACGLNSI
jgi:hypothetical protein